MDAGIKQNGGHKRKQQPGQPARQLGMHNEDQDNRKQCEGLKGNVAGGHMVKIKAIGNEEYGSQNAGEWVQLQKAF